MKSRLLAFGILAASAAVVAAPAANASYVLASHGVATVSDGYSDTVPLLAESFAASGGFNSISVNLALTSEGGTGDTGSVSVYLLTNAGGSPGVAGTPVFTGATLLGTVLDSTLTATSLGAPATLTNFTKIFDAPATANDEYWILVDTTQGQADWWGKYTTDGDIGTDGQFVSWGASPTEIVANVASDTAGIWNADISVPEPATIALLGVGLAGLGFLRRRRHA